MIPSFGKKDRESERLTKTNRDLQLSWAIVRALKPVEVLDPLSFPIKAIFLSRQLDVDFKSHVIHWGMSAKALSALPW